VRSKNLVLFTISLIVLTSVVVYSADAAGIPKKAISTVARFLESDLPTTSVFTDQASTYTAGKQTFVASSSSSAGVNIPTGSDPTTPAQGDIWLNSDTLKYRGTSTHSLITSAITSINSDTNAAQTIQGVSGNTSASTSAGTTTINTGGNVVVTGGSAQTISKQLTINSGVLGGNLNVGSNALTNSGHLVTLPTNTGTVLLTNGSGSSLTNIVTSITGTANNLTSSASTGAVTLNLGSNVVTTGGSAQTISKQVTLQRPLLNGVDLAYVAKTTAYTATAFDTVISVNATSAGTNPTILTLPSASSDTNGTLVIKRIDFGKNVLMIKPQAGQTIDGFANYNITSAKESMTIISDGSNWQSMNFETDSMYNFRLLGNGGARWYGSAITAYTPTTIAPTTTTIDAQPLIVAKSLRIDKIQMEVSTLVAGSTCRMGIYNDNGTTYPSTLISGSDVGTVSGASTGVKTNTFASQIVLQKGLYWIANQCSTATTIVLRGVPATAEPNILGVVSTMGATATGTGWTATNTFGAFPQQFPTAGATVSTAVQPEVLIHPTG